MQKQMRAAAIGSTGKGNFGHGLDVVFKGLPGVEFIAIADDDPAGLKSAGKRTGVTPLYADYREMLAKEKPELVSIGPRWTTQRLEMVQAATAAGAHLYIEKPLADSVAAADELLHLCEKAGVQMAVAHQMRALPPTLEVLRRLQNGKYGKLLRMRARGKEDGRGGGEDLLVLGTHLLDLMTLFAGPPQWVSAHVSVDSRPATVDAARPASEPVGIVAGDNITAAFGFADGVLGFFDSRRNVNRPSRNPYGLFLECEEATVCVRGGEVYVYPSSCIVPEGSFEWEKLWVEDWHFFPDHMPRPMSDCFQRGNQILVADLIEAIHGKRKPLSAGTDARWALEMIQGVYVAHLSSRQIPLPLVDRQHPLAK